MAFVPALAGSHTQGQTLEETEQNVREATAVYLESLAGHGEAIPEEPGRLKAGCGLKGRPTWMRIWSG